MRKIFLLILIHAVSMNCYSQNIKDEINECAKEYLNLQLYQEAIDEYSRIIELFPNDSIAYFDRGYIKLYFKDFKGANEDLSKAIGIDTSNVDNYYTRGLVQFEIKDYLNSIADFDTALNLEEDNSDLHYYRGISHLELKNYLKAIFDFDFALKLNSSFPELVLANKAWANINLKKTVAAKNDVESSIKSSPNFTAFFCKAYIFAEAQKIDSALFYYLSALQNLDSLSDLSEFKKYIHPSINNNIKAVNKYFKNIKFDSESESDIYNYCLLNTFLNNYQIALDSIDIAININPIKANYYFLKAYCLDKLNKQQEALVSYDKAIELCHIKSIFYLRRGNIKLAMGDIEAGKNDIVHYKKMERIFIEKDF